MDRNAWLKGLKAGDQVIVIARYATDEVLEVQHSTACYLTVAGKRYNRKNGDSCGRLNLTLYPPTPEHVERIERKALIHRMHYYQYWGSMSMEKLRAIAAILDEEQRS